MKEFKGTKGPWKLTESGLEYCTYGISDSRNFAMIAHIPNTGDESKNAKLIAAAPDLLEALQKLCFLNSCEEEALQSGRPKPEDWLNAFRKAESAIEKALK